MAETEETEKTNTSTETASAKEPGLIQTPGDKWWWAITIGILLWIGFVSVAVLVMLSRGH
ncbi:MAG: hypothetical protein E6K68_10320 [Nitrospirae bacterium]|nr:MAG: hypothetical protein E6K68_10320 [Nitrospirota bacterium]